MQKLNILVVEDGKSQREMLRDFLRDEGYAVSEAEKGEKALQQIRDAYFDLLLLDYRMPGMDGMEVLEEVKRINPEIDVIMMTAYGTIDMAVKSMKAGAADYVTKPIERQRSYTRPDHFSEFFHERGGQPGGTGCTQQHDSIDPGGKRHRQGTPSQTHPYTESPIRKAHGHRELCCSV